MFAEPLRRRMGILVRENMPWWHSSVRGQVPHAFMFSIKTLLCIASEFPTIIQVVQEMLLSFIFKNSALNQ